jgi:hypothetical protein
MSTSSTPMTWSSSNSSLDSSNDPLSQYSYSSYYKRKNIHISIVPPSYYDNSD